MSFLTLPFFFLFIFLHQTSGVSDGYYWREYTGTIPVDAVAAGKDINDNNVYMGQAYVKDRGIVVVQLTPGVREAYATQGGIRKVDRYIKILCGSQFNFYWMPANSTHLHLLLINKHAVIGGHEDEDSYGQTNIGRISYEGEIKIGKINTFWVGGATFYFHHRGQEKRATSYEVLMYQKLVLDERINDSRFHHSEAPPCGLSANYSKAEFLPNSRFN